MSKLSTTIIAFLSFTLGYITSTLSSQTSDHLQSINQDQRNASSSETIFLNQLENKFDQIGTSNVVTLSQQNQEKLSNLINSLPTSKIDNYLEQAFPDQNLEGIQDKKRFAERLIEEMNQNKDESQTLSGKVSISTNQSISASSSSLSEVNEQQYIYAHFDTYGKVPPNTQVFVKWINQDTQEIILFSPKYIVENSQQNWVSAVPAKGWQPGKYDVKFYQMTDSLTPIAQSSYTIQTVLK